MRIRHYYKFSDTIKGNELNESIWEQLRSSGAEEDKPFAVEKTKEEYEENCRKQKEYEQVAQTIGGLLAESGISSICSFGIGKGILEWHLKKQFEQMDLICTDYTQESLSILRQYCPEMRYEPFDMINGEYGTLHEKDRAALMFRISTEFDISKWKEIFRKLYESQWQTIIFVPTEELTILDALKDWLHHISRIIRRIPDTFCGWCYSKDEFPKMWGAYYTIDRRVVMGKLAIYVLRKQGD